MTEQELRDVAHRIAMDRLAQGVQLGELLRYHLDYLDTHEIERLIRTAQVIIGQ